MRDVLIMIARSTMMDTVTPEQHGMLLQTTAPIISTFEHRKDVGKMMDFFQHCPDFLIYVANYGIPE